ncbi:MAG: flavodoxin family protein [Desulfobacteraceae bacterium]|nr:flavodoxin family protein [Desulfobacteraceae bacterium]
MPVNITAIYGSPRRRGNTATLLKKAVEGAIGAGAIVDEIVLRDIKMSPCMEIYGCKNKGKCIINDGFHDALERTLTADALMIASPIFFYTVSSHMKIFMDRCQSLWVKKYWFNGTGQDAHQKLKKALFISAGATQGKKLFDGVLLTMRYFLDVLNTELWENLLCRGLDHEGDVTKHPEYLEQAYRAGQKLVGALSGKSSI